MHHCRANDHKLWGIGGPAGTVASSSILAETTHDIRNGRHHRRRHYGLRHRHQYRTTGLTCGVGGEGSGRALLKQWAVSTECGKRPDECRRYRTAKARLSGGTDIGFAGSADLVIEAVFERFDLKEELFGRLNPVLNDATVVATNTSCLTVSGLAEAVNDPTRFLGLHYFNPAAINPIVEVVRGKNRARHYRACVQFCAQHRKSILCKDSYGFALNRFFCPSSNEAVRQPKRASLTRTRSGRTGNSRDRRRPVSS